MGELVGVDGEEVKGWGEKGGGREGRKEGRETNEPVSIKSRFHFSFMSASKSVMLSM